MSEHKDSQPNIVDRINWSQIDPVVLSGSIVARTQALAGVEALARTEEVLRDPLEDYVENSAAIPYHIVGGKLLLAIDKNGERELLERIAADLQVATELLKEEANCPSTEQSHEGRIVRLLLHQIISKIPSTENPSTTRVTLPVEVDVSRSPIANGGKKW